MSILLMLFLLLGTKVTADQRTFGVQISTISITFDPEYIDANISSKTSSISWAIVVKRQLNAPLKLHTFLQVKTRESIGHIGDNNAADSGAYRTLVNSSVDYCEFLRNPSMNPVLNLFHTPAVNTPGSRVFNGCPLLVGFYHVNDLNVDFKLFPGKVPSLAFILRITMLMDVAGKQHAFLQTNASGKVGNRPAMGRRRTGTNPQLN